jgi:uncharacterized membrane protein YhhN
MRFNLSTALLSLYLFVLTPINLFGHFLIQQDLVLFSKPLLMPILIWYFVVFTAGVKSNLKYGVIGALFFSWVGDVALMFDTTMPMMFMVGLGGFLVAHLHYVYVFIKTKNSTELIKKSTWFIMPVFALYAVALLGLLWGSLGPLKIPVFIYALVLMLMGVFAVVRKRNQGYNWVLLGAIFFIISDSILAINKFYSPFELAGVFTMLTYVLAQLFIVVGVTKFIVSKH